MGSSFWLPPEKAEHGTGDMEPKARWPGDVPLPPAPSNSTGKGRKVFTPSVTEAPSVLGCETKVGRRSFPFPSPARFFSALHVAGRNPAPPCFTAGSTGSLSMGDLGTRQITALRNHWTRGFWKAGTVSDTSPYPTPSMRRTHAFYCHRHRETQLVQHMAPNQFLSLPFPVLHPYPGHCYSYSSQQLAPVSRKKAQVSSPVPNPSLCPWLPSS